MCLFFFFFPRFLTTVSAQIAHHQYFKVSPQSDVDVIEGSTLLLQCVVGNQRGPVQWAKDGFVLGYDRSIPGYTRYSMIGDATLGVHNLRIVDAKSEDNGEFQCQVMITLLASKATKTFSQIFLLKITIFCCYTLGWPWWEELRANSCNLKSDRSE